MDLAWVRKALLDGDSDYDGGAPSYTAEEVAAITSVYPCPASIVRQRMSISGALILRQSTTVPSRLPRALHIKRAVPSELPARTEPKWKRDCNSFSNEYLVHTMMLSRLNVLDMAPRPIFGQSMGGSNQPPFECGFLTVVSREVGDVKISRMESTFCTFWFLDRSIGMFVCVCVFALTVHVGQQ